MKILIYLEHFIKGNYINMVFQQYNKQISKSKIIENFNKEHFDLGYKYYALNVCDLCENVNNTRKLCKLCSKRLNCMQKTILK